jgi:hypothetical protein
MLLILAILLLIAEALPVILAKLSLITTCSLLPKLFSAVLNLLLSRLFATVSAPTLTPTIASPRLLIGVMLLATSVIVPETVA